VQVGIVGKPNVGKSTFFSAATLTIVPIANYPFTTIKPNHGVSYIRTKCVCKELNVTDNPRNSTCVNGERFIPVDLVDCPGLVPGASEGKGLGNRFLDELRKADALVHVIDASGSTDAEGKLVPPGSHDPLKDVTFLETELDNWMLQILKKDWDKISRTPTSDLDYLSMTITDKFSGLGIKKSQVDTSLRSLNLHGNAREWTEADMLNLVKFLRETSKPILLAANKVDLPSSKANISRMKATISNIVVGTSAEAELALRRANEKGLIDYEPGDSMFQVRKSMNLSPEQDAALQLIRDRVLLPNEGTGVQESINSAFFKLLNMIIVYPVEDSDKLADHTGNVLPDAFLLPKGSTLKDLAMKIHSQLAERILYGINARNGMRISETYQLQDRDVVKIVSAAERG
jgi:ribosome-binding ATPase YchF (GTP1/OBG family)